MSLEHGDLKRLVHSEIHIDEYASKLGEDKDTVVISFKIAGREPAKDLSAFIEKGYEWVLDADVSAGEMSDGDYLLFVEIPRDKDSPANIIEILQDVTNLADHKLEDFRIRYRQDNRDYPADEETLAGIMPLDAASYEQQYGNKNLDELKTAAGVKVNTKAPKNEFTESLRIAAGIL